MVFITVIFPLNNLWSIFFSCLGYVQDFSTECVNEVIFLVMILFINSESLFLVLALGREIYFGSVCVTFNSQVLIVLFAFDKPTSIFLNQSKWLVVTCISFPKDGSSLEGSILSNIQDLSTMDWSEGVIKSFVFSILVLLFFSEEAENHFFRNILEISL